MSDEAEKKYKKRLVALINNCMKFSRDIPQLDETTYEETPDLYNFLNGISVKLLDNMQILIDRLDGKTNISDKTERKSTEDKLSIIVELNDKILDRNNSLNQTYSRKSSSQNPPTKIVERNPEPAPVINVVDRNHLKIYRNLTHNSHLPFKAVLTTKPNAIIPLDVSLNQSPHPYLPEIDRFTPPPNQLTRLCDPAFQFPPCLDDTPYKYIDKREELSDLMSHLKTCSEIAIDLEHNNYRSYLGMTCLLQISTRTHDFIVDTLKLYRHLEVLNEVFTDPNITKVLHGSKSDLSWLQRDFGVYIVNLFDTGVAAELLELPKKSLSYLLSTYCSVETDKKYQLADWRIRPLKKEFIKYARLDTHYLFFIHQKLRENLFDDNLLIKHYEITKAMCQVSYKKPDLSYAVVDSYVKQSNFTLRQRYALYRLWELRDNIARQLDESPEYIIGKRVLLNMAKTLPRDTSGILNCGSNEKKNNMLVKYKMDFLKVCLDAYQEENEKFSNNPSEAEIKTMLHNLSSVHDKIDRVDVSMDVSFTINDDLGNYDRPVRKNLIFNQYNPKMLRRYLSTNPLPVRVDVRQRKLDGELDSVEVGQQMTEEDINMEAEHVLVLEEKSGVTLESLGKPLIKPADESSVSKWSNNRERKKMKTVNNVVPFDYKSTMNDMRQKFCKRKGDNSKNEFKTKKYKLGNSKK